MVAGIAGLGSLSSLYLCTAGIGHLTIVDSGCVQPSDLNRQILYTEKNIGEMKTLAAKRRLSEMNSEMEIDAISLEITEDNVSEMMENVHFVVDGTDNFRTRFLLNAARQRKGIPYIYGGIFGLKGAIMTIIPGKTPCLECFLPKNEMSDSPIPVVGASVGAIAMIQVMEVLKVILHLGEILAGELLVFDGSRTTFKKFTIKKKRDCRVCSGL